MTKTITITNLADLRVGNSIIRYPSGTPGDSLTLVSATREVPDLPSKLGSVIANVVTEDGDRYDRAMLTDPGDSLGLSWVVSSADRSDWVRPDEITSWDACTVEVQS